MNVHQTAVLAVLVVSRLLVGATSLRDLDVSESTHALRAPPPIVAVSELPPRPVVKPKHGVLDSLAAGLLPDTGMDCTRAFQAALEITRLHPGTTLQLKSGDYHFWPQHAAKRDHYQSNTVAVVPKSYALLLDGQQRTVIDGSGATFFFHGPMTAIGLDGCTNVTIRRLKITTPRLFTSQGTVVDIGEDWLVLEIDRNRFPYVIENGKLQTVVEGNRSRVWGQMEYDAVDGRFSHSDGSGISRAEELAPGRVKVWGARDVARTGNILVLRHHERTHAGVCILGSKGVTLKDVEVWGTAGLGILLSIAAT
jgi:hypothetical protein